MEDSSTRAAISLVLIRSMPLVSESQSPAPSFLLEPGVYIVHCAYGLAAATRRTALTGGAAVINLLSILARQHLDALPAPGSGLPGLPVKDDAGVTETLVLLVAVMFFLLGILAAKNGLFGT